MSSIFGAGDSNANTNVIIFDASKCKRKLNEEFKVLQRKLKSKWKFVENNDVLTEETLSTCKVLVLPGPQNKFTELEMNSIRKFLNSSGHILVMLGEGGENKSNTNVNFLLEEFGIMVNNDSVIRMSYSQTMHPKECLISQGMSNKSIFSKNHDEYINTKYLYPYGATLNVAQPSVVALSSGSLAVPMNRPICAYYYSEASGGKLVVLGSSKMLNDMYIEKEKNDLLREVIFDFFESKEIVTKEYQMDDVDFWEYNFVPDLTQQADNPKVCTQDMDLTDNSYDYTKLFKHHLYSINLNMVPSCIKAYEVLDVKHEPLSLIPPHFEAPLPPTQASVQILSSTSGLGNAGSMEQMWLLLLFACSQITPHHVHSDSSFSTNHTSLRQQVTRHYYEYMYMCIGSLLDLVPIPLFLTIGTILLALRTLYLYPNRPYHQK